MDRKNIRKQPPPAHPKPKMFLPHREKTGRLALSTFRIDGLSDSEVWELGDREVAARRAGRKLKGRADLPVETYTKNGLIANADDIPPRHVNIEKWPPEEDKRLQIAQELAAVAAEKSSFYLYPEQ